MRRLFEGGAYFQRKPEFEQQMSKEIDALKRRYSTGNMEELPKFDFDKK